MSTLQPGDFGDFLEAVHGHRPFPWQQMLVERVIKNGWPEGVDLPTASGKTACIDVAVFVLAALGRQTHSGSDWPARRRIFFVVDRRIIVDEAYERARRLANKLSEAPDGVVKTVADELRAIGGSDEPLVVSRLRGGTLRDDAWRLNPAQPAVVTSTVDQVGSRLLFRSYGSGLRSAPVEAGLVACDSLVLLDEAHCAVPFHQTVCGIERYAGAKWSSSGQVLSPPLTVSVLSATLPQDVRDVFPGPDLAVEALDDEQLKRRTAAAKPAVLAQAKKPGKRQWTLGEAVCDDPLVLDAAQRAADLAASGDHSRIAVMVNRVVTAARTHRQLLAAVETGALNADPVLMTGRMRPVDRDELVQWQSPVLKAGSPQRPQRPVVLVATQCLEVGADFSFDALITECASLDALRQRFGRLNRLGEAQTVAAAVLARKGDVKPDEKLDDDKPLDPIYGNALARTWNWLKEHASQRDEHEKNRVFDFGINAVSRQLPADRDELDPLLAPSPDAPVLLPAHMDMLCQTAPPPMPDPDISLFLHGPTRGAPEVRVVFRRDLAFGNEDTWPDCVTVLPPLTAEALAVPLWLARRILAQQPAGEKLREMGDVEGQSVSSETHDHRGRAFVIWRGHRDTVLSRDPSDLLPHETVVLPADEELVELLSEAFTRPAGSALDVAERAYVAARQQYVLRLTPALLQDRVDAGPLNALLDWARDEDRLAADLPVLLRAVGAYSFDEESEGPTLPDWLTEAAAELAKQHPRIAPHPAGVVLFGAPASPGGASLDLDIGDDDDALSASSNDVSIDAHAHHVLERAESWASLCLPEACTEALATAARLHDLGKADPRFQIILHGDEVEAAVAVTQGRLLAKSRGPGRSRSEQSRLRHLAELPPRFRHEMLSLQLAEALHPLPGVADVFDLVLHLVASHHGHARPFAPVVTDGEMPDVKGELGGESFLLTGKQRRQATPPHRLGSGVAERFWRLTRSYGWWQLAYLEAIFRLADRAVSADEAGAARPQEASS